jgi:DNA repair exonuclease SbcCD ATPase subunit
MKSVIEDGLAKALDPWMNTVPDFYDMNSTYKELGRLNAAIRRKKRAIEKIEETIAAETDRPRSNEARINKIHATETLKDELCDLEAQKEEIETTVKAMEFHKTMFNAANFRSRMEFS